MNSPVAAPLQADTAEAVGRRFLAMIASLNVPEDLSEEVLERAMQVRLEDTPAGRLANRPLNGDWVYVVFYTPESQGRRRRCGQHLPDLRGQSVERNDQRHLEAARERQRQR